MTSRNLSLMMVDGKNDEALKMALTKLQVGNYLPIGMKSCPKVLKLHVQKALFKCFSLLLFSPPIDSKIPHS
jgi:hypothetical protein